VTYIAAKLLPNIGTVSQMFDIRYNIVQRGGRWWAVFGRDQLGPFGISRAAVDAAEAEVSVRRRLRHREALGNSRR
jgi:hypothetical protein